MHWLKRITQPEYAITLQNKAQGLLRDIVDNIDGVVIQGEKCWAGNSDVLK